MDLRLLFRDDVEKPQIKAASWRSSDTKKIARQSEKEEQCDFNNICSMLDDYRDNKYNLLPWYTQGQAYIVKNSLTDQHLCQNHSDSHRYRHGNHSPWCCQVLHIEEMEEGLEVNPWRSWWQHQKINVKQMHEPPKGQALEKGHSSHHHNCSLSHYRINLRVDWAHLGINLWKYERYSESARYRILYIRIQIYFRRSPQLELLIHGLLPCYEVNKSEIDQHILPRAGR